jgi:hypothetical protein
MDVPDRLAAVTSGVKDHPVSAARDAFGDRDLVGVRYHLGQQSVPGRRELGHISVMLTRDNQHVNRRLRVNVAEGDRPRIAGDYGRRYLGTGNGAEQAIRHAKMLTCGTSSAPATYMVAVLRTTVHPSGVTASPVSGLRRSGLSHARAQAEDARRAWGDRLVARRVDLITGHREDP